MSAHAEGWHYFDDGVQSDPVTAAELRSLIRHGSLEPDVLVWSERAPEWLPANSHTDFQNITVLPPEQRKPKPSIIRPARPPTPPPQPPLTRLPSQPPPVPSQTNYPSPTPPSQPTPDPLIQMIEAMLRSAPSQRQWRPVPIPAPRRRHHSGPSVLLAGFKMMMYLLFMLFFLLALQTCAFVF